MTKEKRLAAAKILGIVGFLVLVTVTYYIRGEVVALNSTRFSADDLRAQRRLQEWKDGYPQRLAAYETQMKDYEVRMAHYNEMLKLYRTDYDEYIARKWDEYEPPKRPAKPTKPEPPEERNELMEINAKFVAQKHHYFASMRYLNWVACLGALLLTGSLFYLLLFDVEGRRVFYVVLMLLSFVFMIGPSFHSIMSAIVGFLKAPGY